MFEVITIENVWIPMPDGARLSGRLRLPAADDPVPAVLEYLPYRKDDATLRRDEMNHSYLARHGYAMVRVDIRGSGDSDGVLAGEYLPTELDDALAVIRWIAAQPWCDGNVGMMGISWGGFNALQVAALRPPALRAVVSVASTVDRYADDVHYRGGCVLGTDMLAWASTMLCYNARPPTPRIVGGGWRELWLERLDSAPVFLEDWISHQRRDGFWEHGSICEDFAAVGCPVLIVAGFADGYTDTVFKALAGLTTPVRGIVGPWSHNYPSVGEPGPNIGFLGELRRWWDEHLREVPPGDGDSDALRVWMQDWVEPAAHYPLRPGGWVSEPSWPSPNVQEERWWLDRAALADTAPVAGTLTGETSQAYGIRAGKWWGYAEPGTVPGDQRLEEATPFTFAGSPAAGPVEILGMPRLELLVSVDAPVALVSARLCDVAPDGASLLVARGHLNLTHRESHGQPSPMTPGEPTRVAFNLDAVAHILRPGHRWVLHLGTTLWPLAWPAPAPVDLTVHLGESLLVLPVRPPRPSDAELRAFDPPEPVPRGGAVLDEPFYRRTLVEDGGLVTLADESSAGRRIVDDHGTELASHDTDRWTIRRDDPLSARAESFRSWEVRWGDIHCEVRTASELWADGENWHTTNTVTAFENGAEIFTRTREFTVRRDLM